MGHSLRSGNGSSRSSLQSRYSCSRLGRCFSLQPIQSRRFLLHRLRPRHSHLPLPRHDHHHHLHNNNNNCSNSSPHPSWGSSLSRSPRKHPLCHLCGTLGMRIRSLPARRHLLILAATTTTTTSPMALVNPRTTRIAIRRTITLQLRITSGWNRVVCWPSPSHTMPILFSWTNYCHKFICYYCPVERRLWLHRFNTC